MKNILLLSYYYPPYTGIEGNRVYSWANSLADNGFRVTVISRQWKPGGQHVWEDYFSEYHEKDKYEEVINENLRVIRVPYGWSRPFKSVVSSPLSSVLYWYNKLSGRLHIETDAYNALKETAVNELSNHSFDFIIVTSPPLNIVRLGVDLKKQFNIPLVIDFRDSFNNHLLNPNYRPNFASRQEAFLFRYHLKKWLSYADLITSVSQAVLDTLPLKKNHKQLIIMNGYEKDAINKGKEECRETFKVSLIGSLYPDQDIDFIAKGLSAFIQKNNSDKILIQFIGIKSRTQVIQKIQKWIDKKNLFFTDRVLRNEALNYMHTSSILLQVGWKGYKGLCPGKVFEYLASRRNILIAPGDGDLTDAVIRETATGFSANTIDEMVNYLQEKYNEWQIYGYTSYNGIGQEVERYSRQTQNMRLVSALNSF